MVQSKNEDGTYDLKYHDEDEVKGLDRHFIRNLEYGPGLFGFRDCIGHARRRRGRIFGRQSGGKTAAERVRGAHLRWDRNR